MTELESIRSTIEELEQLAEQMESTEIDFQSGQVVNYESEEGSGVAVIESVRENDLTARVMAVAGDNYEPTDDVLTLGFDQVSPHDEANAEEPEDEEEPKEEEENEDEDDQEEEEVAKGMFVSWNSKHGPVIGKVVDVLTGEPAIIPETGDEIKSDKPLALIEVYKKADESYEDTGVHVAHNVSDVEVIDSVEVKQRRLMVKVKNYELESDEEKVGMFKGLGSAYGKVDLGGDTVAKGAYTQTIMHNNSKVQLMFNHGWEVSDVAGIAYLEDSEEGLMVEGKMPLSVPSIKDGYEIMKFMLKESNPLGLSIGYQVIKAAPGPNGTRILKEIALEEMSITPWPMDTHARIRDAKDRKIGYHAKRRGWQTLSDSKTTDAPTGNQSHESEYKSFCGALIEIKNNIEEQYD